MMMHARDCLPADADRWSEASAGARVLRMAVRWHRRSKHTPMTPSRDIERRKAVEERAEQGAQATLSALASPLSPTKSP